MALDVTAGCLEAARGRIDASPEVLAVAGWRAGADALAAWRDEVGAEEFMSAGDGPAAARF